MRTLRFLLLAVLVLAPLGAARAQTRYGNVVNQRFATVSNGPQSSVVVDLPAGASEQRRRDAVESRLRRVWTRQARALAPVGVRSGRRAPLPVSTLVVERNAGRLVAPPRQVTRAFGDGVLTFEFEGFNGASVVDNNGGSVVVETFLKDFLAVLYPKIVALYGKPAASGVVKVRSMGFFEDGSATEVQRLVFGAYNVSENRIYLPLYRSVDSIAHAFMLNVLHAFHGPLALHYDAWEQGFARAAATVLARDPAFGFLDPTANNLYTLLPQYDLINQPALGNSTFFPPSQADIPIDGQFTIAKMLQPRLGMSGAAWLKAYIENDAFFRNFNAAYYAQADGDPALPGNVPALRAIAGAVLPTVEGRPFAQWFERQYVLDTSVTAGPKLYAFILPSENSATSGQSALIVLVHYQTQSSGDETLRTGRAYATYFDAQGFRIPSLGTASEQTQIEAGEGFLTTLAFPNQGFDDGRITMDFAVNGITTRTWLPSGIEGDVQAVLPAAGAAGDVAVDQLIVPSGATRGKTGAIARGGFGLSLGAVFGELARTTVTVLNAGVTTTYRRNTGDGINWLVLAEDGASGGVVDVAKVFPTDTLRLVSFPVRPLNPSVESALGLGAAEFVLTQWDPLRNLYEMVVPDKPVVGALTPGRGYWMRLLPNVGAVNHQISLKGVAPARDVDFTIAAPYGWNLIGSPFADPIDLEQILVKFLENDPIPWSEAVTGNLVAAQPFAYDPATRAYTAASTLDGGAWQGYWLRVFAPAGVTLLLPGPDAPSRAARVTRSVAPRRTQPFWSVRLRAARDGQSAAVALGAAPGATAQVDARWDTELPPDPGTGATLSLGFAGGASGGRRVGDFRGDAEARRGVWKLHAYAATAGPVTLTWDGLGSLPRGTRLMLADDATGETIPLGSRSGTTLRLAAGERRSLTLRMEPERSTPLAFARVRTAPVSRAVGGARIEYALTGDAEVGVEVATLSGRVLRRLETGRATAGQSRSVVWDGRGGDGAPLPAGTYLLTLTARGDDGATARQIRPIQSVR